ncbi:MAG: hypothetical protein KDE27_30095 [Planctomycetes bacterium]|nr:hypothetical protein [Planctomycetota bacterium]
MSGISPLLRRLGAAFLTLFVAGAAATQVVSKDEFRTGFSKAVEIEDVKLQDKWMRRQGAPALAWIYYEELLSESMGGNVDNSKKTDALRQSWERCFDDSDTLRRVGRWLESIDRQTYDGVNRIRQDSAKLWRGIDAMPNPTREELLTVMGQYRQLGENARSFGHMLEVAEQYANGAVMGARIKAEEQTLDDKRAILAMSESYLEARESWSFKFDTYYQSTAQFVKDSKARIAEAEKKADKRAAEGYTENTKGIDALVMPNVAAQKVELGYGALKAWDKELDYGPKNGMFPPLWWNATCKEPGTASQLSWFQRTPIYFGRTGGNKFVITLGPAEVEDKKGGVPINVSSKPKPSTFWLDAEKKVPYTMFFWVGSDREHVGLAECNLAPRADYVLTYYKSGASWDAKIDKDTVTFYDDNCNGKPGEADVWAANLRVNTAGEHEGEGTPAPHMDSMRVGKGDRVPVTEFVQLSSGWVYLQAKGDHVEYRPLNPEYFKTGKIKLVWDGPKDTRPAQLVIQGKGDYRTAYADIASGKEVEVPAGEWSVIFGRVVAGKGSRIQNATIYPGTSESFAVAPGEVKELKMGAPFTIAFEREGDKSVKIDALKVFVKESSGCIFTELQGCGIAPEVLAAKDEDGKGSKAVAHFVEFSSGELVNKAGTAHPKLSTLCALFPMPQGYREGPLVLEVEMPSPGMKVGLEQKKHGFFGELRPEWK